MTPPGPACFGYRIYPDGDGWRWTAFDSAGRVRAQGRASSRAVAAARVICELAEDALAPAA